MTHINVDSRQTVVRYDMILHRAYQQRKYHLFIFAQLTKTTLDSKVHGANTGPIWGPQDPGGPHVGPMNFATLDTLCHALLARAELWHVFYQSFLEHYSDNIASALYTCCML